MTSGQELTIDRTDRSSLLLGTRHFSCDLWIGFTEFLPDPVVHVLAWLTIELSTVSHELHSDAWRCGQYIVREARHDVDVFDHRLKNKMS